MDWCCDGHQSNQSSRSGLTFSRKHHLLPRSAFPPSWHPSMSPEEEGRLIGRVGLEGEDTREACSARQHLLHWRMSDPTHVHNGGGCSHPGPPGPQDNRTTGQQQGALKTASCSCSGNPQKQEFNGYFISSFHAEQK